MKFKEPENLKSVHFYIEELSFSIVIYACSEWDEIQINYLNQNYDSAGYTSYTLCKWCQNHNIEYSILYPLSKLSILRNPYKYYKYLQLKIRLPL